MARIAMSGDPTELKHQGREVRIDLWAVGRPFRKVAYGSRRSVFAGPIVVCAFEHIGDLRPVMVVTIGGLPFTRGLGNSKVKVFRATLVEPQQRLLDDGCDTPQILD